MPFSSKNFYEFLSMRHISLRNVATQYIVICSTTNVVLLHFLPLTISVLPVSIPPPNK